MPPPETRNETEIARGLGEKKKQTQQPSSVLGDVISLRCSCFLPGASCDWGWEEKRGEKESVQGLIEGMSAELVFSRGLAGGACVLLISIRRKARNLSAPPGTRQTGPIPGPAGRAATGGCGSLPCRWHNSEKDISRIILIFAVVRCLLLLSKQNLPRCSPPCRALPVWAPAPQIALRASVPPGRALPW